MTRASAHMAIPGLAALAIGLAASAAQAEDLSSFAILAGSTITNTGVSTISGNIGLSPGSAVTGFGPGADQVVQTNGTLHVDDGVANTAKDDLATAYAFLMSRPTTINITDGNLGGKTLTAGVYNFDSTALLSGTLTLDAQGDPNAVFIIKIGSALTTASASTVVLENGAYAGNVFFVVGSSATLGTTTEFAGQILALTDISLNNKAKIDCGAALARNGQVTLDTNTINICALTATTVGAVLDSTASENQKAVGDALDKYVTDGGTLPLGFALLASTMTPTELAAALTQLSGEVATTVAPSGMQAMNGFLSTISDHFDDRQYFPPDAARPPQRATVKALGYGPEDRPSPSAARFADFDHPAGWEKPAPWTVWGTGYGESGKTEGVDATGSHDRSLRNWGLAAGFDNRINPDLTIGVALGGGTSHASLSDNLGQADSDNFQAALYGRQSFGAAYLQATGAFSWHDITTDRTVTVAGRDHFTADFSAYDIAADIEGGYRFALPELAMLRGSAGITPYAGIRAQMFHTPSYAETTESGSSTYALAYDANTTNAIRSELGIRFDRDIVVDPGAIIALKAGVAWAHEFETSDNIAATFQSLPGSNFTVDGAPLAADSLLLSASAELKLKGGFATAALFDGAFSQGSQYYSGTARISYSW